MKNGVELRIKVFTHPACHGCGQAVEMAWNLTQEQSSLKLQTIRLEDKKGLEEAHEAGVKTIPTLIYYEGDEERKRFVGLPDKDEFRKAYLKLAGKE